MENRLIIIDSNALLHRAFHALPPLANSSGQETGAVYGYLLTLFKAIKDLSPNYIVACFDTKAKTFRHEQFQDYKAQRPVTPSGIIFQIPITKDVLKAFGVPVFFKDGFEADDLIATICDLTQKQNKNLEIYILTGDLDNLQLVNEKIKVYTLGKGIKDTIIYDINKVEERFGVKPEQMVDFKALTGDPSDNIPGVEGIGKKTAAEIIQKYGTIKNLYEELSTDTAVLKPKVKEALQKNKETALMSLGLVKMKNDVEIFFNIEDCKFGKFNKIEVENIFKKLDFNSLISRIP
ncbi:MAG: 5'-3' exonuclease H3TH domain-containing protein [Candidatus Staskawiczbacteria bacterium]|nr:5'-3' exonuclease H3TH domain-containing protein [Candidatus Staskawiczbacteria bacterium]